MPAAPVHDSSFAPPFLRPPQRSDPTGAVSKHTPPMARFRSRVVAQAWLRVPPKEVHARSSKKGGTRFRLPGPIRDEGSAMSEIDRLALPASATPEQRGNGEAIGMRPHRDSPMRRKMASGRVVWLARYTRPDGRRAYWKPDWNRGSATFEHRHDAQRAIDEAHLYNYR